MIQIPDYTSKIHFLKDKIKSIVGLTGPINSGCTTAAKYLEKFHNYHYLSISENFITKEFGKGEKNRQKMQDFGNGKRKENPNYFVECCINYLYDFLKSSTIDSFVVECLRNHVEVQEFNRIFGDKFFLIAIYADRQVRYERYNVDHPEVALSTFDEDDDRDSEDFYLYGQQILRCVELADGFLTNNSMITAFRSNFKDYLNSEKISSGQRIELEEKLKPFFQFTQHLEKLIFLLQSEKMVHPSIAPGIKPSPQEIYINIAYSLSLFSECRKRKVGAIITKTSKNIGETGQSTIKDANNKILDEYLISGGFNQIIFEDQFCKTNDFCFRLYNKLKYVIRTQIKCPFCGGPLGIFSICRIDGHEEPIDLRFEHKESDSDRKHNFDIIKEKRLCPNKHLPCYFGEKNEIIIKCITECPKYKSKRPDNIQKVIFYGKDLYDCQALHAEENAILNSSRFGSVSLKDTTLYTTTFPCLLCTKKIIATNIKKIIYMEAYPDPRAEESLIKAGVELCRFQGITSKQFYKIFKQYFL